MPRVPLFRHALAATLSLVALAACADLLAIGGPVTVADAGPSSAIACGLSTDSASCQACVEAHCCAEATACAASDGCLAHESCVIPCGTDYACRAACLNANPPSTPGVAAVDRCLVSSCSSECGIECGTTGFQTQPDAAPECVQCLVAKTCTASQACGASLECTQILDCQTACTTPDCEQACSIGEDAGAALVRNLSSAFASSCITECQYGEHWGCLGNVSFPLAPSPTIALTVGVTITPTNAQAQGVSVKACTAIDPDCASPVATETTDASGLATLVIPAGGEGFAGHIEVSGDGLTPELYFFDYYLTEPTSSLTIDMFTSASFASYVGIANVTLDPTRGTILVAAFDCALETSANVVFSATGTDAQSQLLYVSGDLPSNTATTTDTTGTALLVNVPPGPVTVTAKSLTAAGQVSSTTRVAARAGCATYVGMYPN
jgi:hypothetical protein